MILLVALSDLMYANGERLDVVEVVTATAEILESWYAIPVANQSYTLSHRRPNPAMVAVLISTFLPALREHANAGVTISLKPVYNDSMAIIFGDIHATAFI